MCVTERVFIEAEDVIGVHEENGTDGFSDSAVPDSEGVIELTCDEVCGDFALGLEKCET